MSACLIAVACGNATGPAAQSPSPVTPERYVEVLCGATNDFAEAFVAGTESLGAVFPGMTAEDGKLLILDFMDTMQEAAAMFADAMRVVAPPNIQDLRALHDELIDRLDELEAKYQALKEEVGALEIEGDAGDLFSAADPFLSEADQAGVAFEDALGAVQAQLGDPSCV